MSCPDCFSGHIHAGTPTGRVTKLHGLDVYVAEPPASAPAKGIVIIIPDAFGWEFVNNRILADHYAERGGYMVYLPEFMNGGLRFLLLLLLLLVDVIFLFCYQFHQNVLGNKSREDRRSWMWPPKRA